MRNTMVGGGNKKMKIDGKKWRRGKKNGGKLHKKREKKGLNNACF